MTVGEITDRLDVGQSTVSHHLEHPGRSALPSGGADWHGQLLACSMSDVLNASRTPRASFLAKSRPTSCRRWSVDDLSGRDLRRRYGNLAMACDEGSLSCGNPFSMVDLKPGERVLDLGSGTGGDVLVSAERVGPTGKVWGLDMTPEMLDRARASAVEKGLTNVEFLEGYIEQIPLPSASVDVVISNCVIVLSADKSTVFAEVARVLVPGGRMAIADLMLESAGTGEETYCQTPADCGQPIDATTYRHLLSEAGLVGISIEPTHIYAPGVASAAIRAERPLSVQDGHSVRSMVSSDWSQVAAIYEEGIAQRRRHI